MKLPKSMKKRILEEQEKVFEKMSEPDISQDDWELLNDKYQAYSGMLKTPWNFTPDTLLIVGGNQIGRAHV